MTELELKERLKAFSKRIINLVDNLPQTNSAIAIGKQIVRSGTSPGANYRAACIGKSEKDFLNKLKMVEEELDETGPLSLPENILQRKIIRIKRKINRKFNILLLLKSLNRKIV